MARRHVTIELTELEARALSRFLEFWHRFADCVPVSWSWFWKMREVADSNESAYKACQNAPNLTGVRAALRRAWWKAKDGLADLDGGA